MLIIAIPKSASTSLMSTLGYLHDLPATQDFSFRNNSIPDKSRKIHTVHSDIRELTPELVDKFVSKKSFFKQHIFPSTNNMKLLESHRKVVLLRDPNDILKAYLRGKKKRFNGLPDGYHTKMTNKSMLKKAKEDGFFNDIVYFHDEWLKKNDSKTLIIFYKDYLRQTKKTINDIETFFNLEISISEVKPLKMRYSRQGIFVKLKKKLKRILLN